MQRDQVPVSSVLGAGFERFQLPVWSVTACRITPCCTIDDEMERLALTFHRRATARRRVLPTAYNAGKEAGERFEYRPGIEQG